MHFNDYVTKLLDFKVRTKKLSQKIHIYFG